MERHLEKVNLKNKTILIAEDDRNLMDSIFDILTIQGCNVLTAENGVKGVSLLQEQDVTPDLIISDIMMPGMNGYQLLDVVRHDDRWRTIPFIFLTAKTDQNDVFEGKMMGVEGYIPKPFDAENLVVEIGATIKRSKELEAIRKQQIQTVKHSILDILNHELRTPLASLVGFAELASMDILQKDAGDVSIDELRTFLNGMFAGATRLRRMIENLTLLVELKTGETETTMLRRQRPIYNLDSLIDQAIKLAQPAAEEKGVTFEVDFPEEGLPKILGDNDYVRTILVCLVDNAVKFSDKSPATVTVAAYADADYVNLSVTDQGRGIAASEREVIFEEFYQINRKFFEDQGAGAGLAIVKRLVELHKGKIEVESKPDVGSRFTVRLPIYRAEE